MTLGKGIDSAITDDIENEQHVKLIHFLKFELDSGTLYLHDGVGSFEWADPDDGLQTWAGLGDFGGINDIEENVEMSAYEVELMLSGLDDDMVDEVQNQNYTGRKVTIYLSALHLDDYSLLATPHEIWSGEADVARGTLGAGEDNNIVITCESDFADLDRINGSVFSDADLQAEYSGDLFCEYFPAMMDASIVWRGDSRIGFSDRSATPTDFDPGFLPRF